MSKVKTFKIYTLGCKINQYDSGWLSAQLQNFGFKTVDGGADLAIINTCAVTQKAITKGSQMINKAKNENPKAKIVILGCWPKTYKINANNLNVDLVINSKNLKTAIKEIKKLVSSDSIVSSHRQSLKIAGDRARYFIKIQDGCDQFCSYCIIPFARGPIKSRGEQEIINEINEAIKQGYQEIVLSGIHLGKYGKDLGRIDLYSLLKKIVGLPDLGRIRLSSIEINEVTDDLIKLISANKKMAKHLHIPLQSGSDKILKLMNRPYDKKFFAERIKKIRKAMPNIALTTDVIVGFPGEAEEDFKKTYSFIKKTGFSRLHIFPFSAHGKTKAFNLPDRIDERTKKSRAESLRKLGDELQRNYIKKFENKYLDVLIENISNNQISGKSEYYFDVNFIKEDVAKVDINRIKTKDIVKVKF